MIVVYMGAILFLFFCYYGCHEETTSDCRTCGFMCPHTNTVTILTTPYLQDRCLQPFINLERNVLMNGDCGITT